jgi:hypothetical protein
MKCIGEDIGMVKIKFKNHYLLKKTALVPGRTISRRAHPKKIGRPFVRRPCETAKRFPSLR